MNGLFNILAALLLGGAVVWVGYAVTREESAERTAADIEQMREDAAAEAEQEFASRRTAPEGPADLAGRDMAPEQEADADEEPAINGPVVDDNPADQRLADNGAAPADSMTGMQDPYTPGVARSQMNAENNQDDDEEAEDGENASGSQDDQTDDADDNDAQPATRRALRNGADGQDEASPTAGLNNPGGQMRRVDKPDTRQYYTGETPVDKPDEGPFYTDAKPVDKPDTEDYYTEAKPVDKPDSESFYTENKPLDKPDTDRYFTENRPLDKPDTDQFYTATTPLPGREYAGVEAPCLRPDGTPYTGPGTVQNPFAPENPCLVEETPIAPILVQQELPPVPQEPIVPPQRFADNPKKCIYRPGTYTARPVTDGRGDGWMADFGCFAHFDRPGFGPSPTPEDSGSDYL